MTVTENETQRYSYRIMYKHFDGAISVDTENCSPEYGQRRVKELNNGETGREWWLERQPLGEWERI